MVEYEMIRELFNNCSGKAVPIVEEIETDDLETFMHTNRYIMPGSNWDRSMTEDGAIVYDVFINGLRCRYSFTEI